MTVVSKIAGGLGLVSCLYDMHKTAMVYSKNEYAKVSSDSFISEAVACQKTRDISYRDAKIKNWILKNNDTFSWASRAWASVKGYVKGFAHGLWRHLPTVLLSIPAIFVAAKKGGNPDSFFNKNAKVIANVAAAGVAVSEAVDIAVNGTNIGEKKDYLRL